MSPDDEWENIDASLIRMRRLLEPSRQASAAVDLSAVLVVDTIARRAANLEQTRITDVASHLSVKPSTASRLVASTEAAGYIRRSPSPTDPRSVGLSLTPSGDSLNAAARQFRISLLQDITAQWDADSVATFARLLDAFSRAAVSAESALPRN